MYTTYDTGESILNHQIHVWALAILIQINEGNMGHFKSFIEISLLGNYMDYYVNFNMGNLNKYKSAFIRSK